MSRLRRKGASKWQDVADALAEAEDEREPADPRPSSDVSAPPPAARPPDRLATPREPLVPESPPATPPAAADENEPRTYGAWLQRAREQRGISIDDLAHLTKIRRAIVVSLERDARRELPEKVFVVGYVRSYAAAVGLDAEDALRRFHAAWSEDEEPGAGETGMPTEARSYAWVAPLLAAIVAAAVLWYIVTSA